MVTISLVTGDFTTRWVVFFHISFSSWVVDSGRNTAMGHIPPLRFTDMGRALLVAHLGSLQESKPQNKD